MENDIIDSLTEIKYEGKLKEIENLEKAVEGGSKNVEYTELVSMLTKELKSLCNMEEEVNVITSPEDSSAFLMEVSSFLKEIGCPYENLTSGHLSDRLITRHDKLLLLDYLLSELMAARMIKATKPDDEDELSLKIQESDTARAIKNLLLTLQFNKPPANITAPQLFQKIETKINELMKKNGGKLIGKPAFTGTLSDKQWDALHNLQTAMHDEYSIRRETLIKRLDVTVQSFQWSDKMKGKDHVIQDMYKKKAGNLSKKPDVDLSNLLAARDDITIIEKTSSASVRKNTQSSINKVMIGQVPDRGGRPNEQQPPPPEMPSWQQRGGGGGRGGGGRGGGRGGGAGQDRGGGNFGGNSGGQGFGGSGGGGGGYNRGGGNQTYGGGNNTGRGDYSRQNSANSGGYSNNSDGGYNRGSGGGGGNYGGGGGGRNSYQSQGTTYADQYVQDSSQNQSFGGRNNYNRGGGGGRGSFERGRSNYNRGGGGGYR